MFRPSSASSVASALRTASRAPQTRLAANLVFRGQPRPSRRAPLSTTSAESSPTPWFIDPSPPKPRQPTPHAAQSAADLPADLPHPLRELHAALSVSPHLEPGTLFVGRPTPIPFGPPLPLTEPQGRRRRGGTYSGEGLPDDGAGIWSWMVMAEVRHGTEGRGAIEAVVRTVRKTLLGLTPPVPLPPKSKRRMNNGWAMIDAGNFIVHVVGKDTKAKYFSHNQEW
ncbi:hypothetical protein CONPUDRAFT_149864 [Coniophora puteana RWD-64-598 SS2]|uniref:Uncharacterized protein n=1 Tax=Coniophora puteana (strain RWD-64-598) TaxID=741705 RepID=A0A5M3N0Q9_CONPW|nr:uncharacterized protein CONPUDRAFT_149864 [Coniophora puteana RWD-64-598 SS2]EIW85000.1 hypothetical protein CONPUDRAFT_149864 [Coniophora puteana RWD-64-598 SS2]